VEKSLGQSLARMAETVAVVAAAVLGTMDHMLVALVVLETRQVFHQVKNSGSVAVSSDGGTGGGGDGRASTITGGSVTYAGGGGGGRYAGGQRPGGSGGGGAGSDNGSVGGDGTANLGGGGGSGTGIYPGTRASGDGGKGVVILKVPTDNYSGTTTGSPTVTTSGDYKIIEFTGTGTYTA